jgi:hypothetical protein
MKALEERAETEEITSPENNQVLLAKSLRELHLKVDSGELPDTDRNAVSLPL